VKPEFYLDTIVFWQKPIFAGKNYFCQSGFYHGKTIFSTDWLKPANPDSATCHPTLVNAPCPTSAQKAGI